MSVSRKSNTTATRLASQQEDKGKTQFPAALYIVSVLIVALGLSFIFLVPQGYQSYLAQSQASNWPQTEGKVLSSEVLVDERRPGIEDDLAQPKVVTRYSVNGRKYTTREIHFNQSRSWTDNYGAALAVVDQYPPGKEVTVYYNPEQPYQAVLSIRWDWFTFFIMGLGALFVLFGVYCFWLSLRDSYRFLISGANSG